MIRLITELSPCVPAYGLAVEEALFEAVRRGGEDTLRLWVNERAVIIGRSQSIAAEVDLAQAARFGIPVLRRISGGGAVYHYPGNLNLSLYLKDSRFLGGVKETFRRVGETLSSSLAGLGITITAKENGLFVGKKKLAGAAQARRGCALLYHTTLLVKPDTLPMECVLRAMHKDYRPMGIFSNAHPVTTIVECAQKTPSAKEIALRVSRDLCWMLHKMPHEGRLTEKEKACAERLVKAKYETDGWNFSR